uniref:Family with sequence similarity 81 member B n=1 Tax=Aotus nancymaae TaxID=37293 RepID=A0A2K5E0J0_AOTNA
MSSYTDVNKSASPTVTAEEQPDEPDGPLPGSANDQEKKVRLSPAKMSSKNSTDLAEYVDKSHPFLPLISNTQRGQLEDRLNNQERTVAFLLEQAFRIKEDISACLQGALGFRKEESLARKLLESHIQTITSIVKKLSQNIEILEDQIRARDQAATGANFAAQEINLKHLQGVGDLRGRVARCDSSIVKLSGDIHFIRQEYRQIEKVIQEFMPALETLSKNLDMKVTENRWDSYFVHINNILWQFYLWFSDLILNRFS